MLKKELDIKGLCCPEVLINVRKTALKLKEDTELKILTTAIFSVS